MKTLALLIIFSLVSATSELSLSQTTRSKQEGIVINKKGEIFNNAGAKLGYIDKNDIVRNTKGQKLYFIDKSGNVIDKDGRKLGKAEKNGNFYNAKGVHVIKVSDTNAEMCVISDPKGHKRGVVHRNYKLHACASHCFFLQAKKIGSH